MNMVFMMKMLSGWHIIVMIKTFCLPMGHKEVISIQWFHTANNGMISQMTSSFSSKLLQTPPPSSKWWVISYYNTTNAFIGMHSLCLWGSGLILAETREDPFTLYGRRRRSKRNRKQQQRKRKGRRFEILRMKKKDEWKVGRCSEKKLEDMKNLKLISYLLGKRNYTRS